MESYRTDATYIHEIISKNLPTIPTSRTKCHMRFMLGLGSELVGRFRLFSSGRYCILLGAELVGRFRLFSSVRYCILPGAVWCGAVHTFSHTRWLRCHSCDMGSHRKQCKIGLIHSSAQSSTTLID